MGCTSPQWDKKPVCLVDDASVTVDSKIIITKAYNNYNMLRPCIQGNGEIYFGIFSVSLVYGRKAIRLENIQKQQELNKYKDPVGKQTNEGRDTWDLYEVGTSDLILGFQSYQGILL